jgi:hypothetical protein
MIHEYAQVDIKGTKGVRDTLGVAVVAQESLTASANACPS